MMEAFEQYAKGLHAYRSQNWEGAVDFFSRTLSIIIDDGPSRTMLARSEDFKINPPGKEWDGTYSVMTK